MAIKGIKDEQQQFPHDSTDDLFTELQNPWKKYSRSQQNLCPPPQRPNKCTRRMGKKEEDTKAAPLKEAPQQAQLIRESERARLLAASVNDETLRQSAAAADHLLNFIVMTQCQRSAKVYRR